MRKKHLVNVMNNYYTIIFRHICPAMCGMCRKFLNTGLTMIEKCTRNCMYFFSHEYYTLLLQWQVAENMDSLCSEYAENVMWLIKKHSSQHDLCLPTTCYHEFRAFFDSRLFHSSRGTNVCRMYIYKCNSTCLLSKNKDISKLCIILKFALSAHLLRPILNLLLFVISDTLL